MSSTRIPRVLAGTLILAAATFGTAQAQSMEPQDVVITNDHLHVHQVFVIDAEGERHQLGFVGHDETKSFDVPSKYEVMGSYRIALQQYLPLAGLGVPVDAPPYKLTHVLEPMDGRVVSIVVGNDAALSSVEVIDLQQEQEMEPDIP
jgi:hypothetical protein